MEFIEGAVDRFEHQHRHHHREHHQRSEERRYTESYTDSSNSPYPPDPPYPSPYPPDDDPYGAPTYPLLMGPAPLRRPVHAPRPDEYESYDGYSLPRSTLHLEDSRSRVSGESFISRALHAFRRSHRHRGPEDRPSFYSAYARAARRYGIGAGLYTGFVKQGNSVLRVTGLEEKQVDHEVSAESIQNATVIFVSTEYVVPVTIGSPGVTLHLDFDTGSSDLWVWSSEFNNYPRYSGHAIYDPNNSSTAERIHGTWNISYGDGSSASGDVWTDVVSVAGVTIPYQAIETSQHLSDQFLQDSGNDGLLGLAWPQINTVEPRRVKTPVENMIDMGLIDQPLFTVKLTRGNEPGFYSFGYIDESVTPYPIRYTPVDNSQGFWQVSSDYYSINGRNFVRHDNTAILDTGTTLCLVSEDVVEAIYSQIHGAVYDDQQGGWKYPTGSYLPEIAFAVGNTLYKINPVDIGFGSAGEGYTFGGIQSRGDMNYDIFGDVFLRSVYAVFNQGERKVGLAQRDN